MVSLLIIGLYAVGNFALGIAPNTLFIPDIALLIAIVNALYSLLAYIFIRDSRAHATGLIAFTIMCVNVALLVGLTGGVHSPFVAMWLLIAVFAGLFGWSMLLAFAIVANAYATIMITTGTETGSAALSLLLVVEAPLIASSIIWHHWRQTSGDQAVTELKQELSQVSLTSDIVINSIADGVVMINPKGAIALLNPAAQMLLGWSAHDGVGLDYRSVVKLTDTTGTVVPD